MADQPTLAKAQIFEVDESGEKTGSLAVECMFNPYEYTVSKSNSYSDKSNNGSSTPEVEFTKSGAQTLKISLIFDTYEEGSDVSTITRKLWKFMEPKQGRNEKQSPPEVAFQWGVFYFVAVITNMTQKFTLFKPDGTPVRAKVDVTFTQHKDLDDYDRQNPTSGGGPVQRLHSVVRGDRLDTIAARFYGDATKWRAIAAYNGLTNPLHLQAGQRLVIPEI